MKSCLERNKSCLIGILVFLISLGVYIHTLAPTITYEDSGELITSPYILGISHPPGYPFYTTIMKVLISLLPVSNIAFRGNLATALWGSLGILMVYFIVLKVEGNLIKEGKTDSFILLGGYVPAIVASLLASFSGMIWLHSVTTEVYTLNLFLMMFLTYILLIWEENKDIRYLFFASIIYALSFGNHQEAILFFPGFAYFCMVTDLKQIFKIKNLLFIIFVFCLGLLIYAYMPIRSAQNPFLDWGNPESWQGFLFSIKREQYGSLEQARDIKRWIQQLNLFGFIEQVGISAFFFAFFGLWRLFRKNLKYFIVFSLMTFCSGIGFVYLVNPPIPTQIFALLRTFYLPLYALFAIWIASGVSFVLEKLYFYWERLKLLPGNSWSFVLVPFILLPVSSLWKNYKEYDLSRCYFAYDYAVNMSRSVGEKSVVFTYLSGDTFPLWYYKYSEGRRPDLAVIHQRMLSLPWYFAQVIQDEPQMVFTRYEFLNWKHRGEMTYKCFLITKDIMDNNKQYKFYYTLYTKDFLPKDDSLIPKGILWQEKKENIETDEAIWLNYSYRGLGDERIMRGVRTNEVLRQLYALNLTLAREYMTEDKPELSIYQYQIQNKIQPEPEAYYNMGYSYYKLNNISSALLNFKQFLKMSPTGSQADDVRKWMEYIQSLTLQNFKESKIN